MYGRYNKCKNYYHNIDVIDSACDNIPTITDLEYMSDDLGCECGFSEDINYFPYNPMLAQSYVPYQYMGKTYTPACGLQKGSMFPELVAEYEPCQSMREIEYIRKTNEIGKGCNK